MVHAQLDNASRPLREYEFVDYLIKLMELSKQFRYIQAEKLIDTNRIRLRADIAAEEIIHGAWQPVIIETKSYTSLLPHRANDVVAQIEQYRKVAPNSKFILAFPGNLLPDTSSVFEKAQINVWDVDYIAARFSKEIHLTTHPILQPMLIAARTRVGQTREDELITQLKLCASGRDSWSVYQKLIGAILEKLFCPPLSSPLSEQSDANRVNRRDYILPNYAESGFWSYLRIRYLADYIVVDAKNYKNKIKKETILQIANYLKAHGAGLFGMIICRNGADSGSLHTRREVWATDRKLIVILEDEDVEQMLLAQRTGTPPESVIKQRIEDFRLAL